MNDGNLCYRPRYNCDIINHLMEKLMSSINRFYQQTDY